MSIPHQLAPVPAHFSIRCSAGELQRALACSALAVLRRGSVPILEHVLLQVEGNRLTLTTTNLTFAIRCQLSCTPAVPAAGCTMLFRPLYRWIQRRKPEEALTITAASQAATIVNLQIRSAGARLEQTGTTTQLFPAVPADPVAGTPPLLTFPLPDLRASLTRVQYAAAANDSPLLICQGIGVRATPGASLLQVAALDGYRGALSTVPLVSPVAGPTPFARALPLAASQALVTLIRQILASAGETERPTDGALYHVGPTQVIWELTPTIRLLTSVHPGGYPDLANQVPTEWRARATVGRAPLAAALTTLNTGCRPGATARLRLEAVPASEGQTGYLMLRVADPPPRRAQVVLDALVIGQPSVLALNAEYLAATLAVMTTDQVALDWPPKAGPCLVRPVPARGEFHLIMPMYEA